MILETCIKDTIKQDYLFLEGTLNIGTLPIIDDLENGLKYSKNPVNNVRGQSTDWTYFCKNFNFLSALFPIHDYLDNRDDIRPYQLTQAWGLKEGYGDFTIKHDHVPSYLSGVLYLNNHDQLLQFPEINRKIKPAPGKFVLFSSFLKHYAKRMTTDKYKYAISFNLGNLTDSK